MAPIVPPTVPSTAPSKASATASQLSGERKFVSVVFADVSGFTAMSEKLDAEKVTDIMNQLFQRLGAVVSSLDGYIDKFIGDCVMALFGAPVAHENDPELAVECALRMREAIEAFNRETNLDLGLSIGINSGTVVAGAVGSDQKTDYTVMGDAVNLAQRLQSAASRGQIYVSRSVQRSCEGRFEFTPIESLKVKGKEKAVEAFEVISRKKDSTERRISLGQNAPLFGRESELLLVDRLLVECKESRGQTLLISGEPGVGKSRLREEISKRVRSAEMHFVEARCSPLGQERPYGPFVDILRAILGLDARLDHVEQVQKVTDLSAYELDQASEIFIRDLLGLALEEDEPIRLEGAQRKMGLKNAIKGFLLSASKSKPLMVYFEDLHWMDPLSIEMMGTLIEALPKWPLLMAGSSRPDFKNEWMGKRNLHVLNLVPLTKDQVLKMVECILGWTSVPEDLAHVIVEKSEGNPLYVEEIIKSLVDAGRLIQTSGVWALGAQSEALEIPHTIQGLMASRLDRLGDRDRLVLQLAAVIGRRFSRKLLESCSTLEGLLEAALPELLRREFIFESSESASGDTIYTFNHALMQEVTYQGILSKNRKRYHEEVGCALEAIAQSSDPASYSDYLGALSYHFCEADHFDKGTRYLFDHGAHLAGNYENEGAIRSFEKALHWIESRKSQEYSDLGTKISIELAILAQRTGDLKRAEELQTKLISEATDRGDHRGLAVSHRHLGELHRQRGRFDDAMKEFQTALDSAVQAKDYEAQVRTWKSLGNLLKDLNNLPKALEILDKGLLGAKSLKNKQLVAQFLNDRATVLLDLQRLDEATAALSESIEIAEQDRALKSLLVSSTNNLGCILQSQSNFLGAIQKYRTACRVAKEIGDWKNRIIAGNNACEILLEFNDFAGAVKDLEENQRLAQESGNHSGRITAVVMLGYAKAKQGEVEEGLRVLREMQVECAERKFWNFYVDALIYEARILFEKPDLQAAMNLLKQGLAKGAELGNELLKKRCEQELDRLTKAFEDATQSKA